MGLFGGYGLRAAFALSKLGERIGSDALIYNPGVFWHFHGMARANAPAFADELLAFAPDTKSIADVGCGSGAYAAEFNRRGLNVWAGEYAATGRWIARQQGLTPQRFDVTDPSTHPNKTFDLAYSIEVAEHLPDALADRFVGFLVRMSGLLIVTAAVPGQGGHGHINEQPAEYWISKFAAQGFTFDAEGASRLRQSLGRRNVSSCLSNNVMVFRGVPAP